MGDFEGIEQGAKTWSPSWLHASRNCPLRRVLNLGNPSILWPVAWFKKQGGWCGKVLKTNIFFVNQVLLQLEFLTGLLDLPPSSRTVGTLSGGPSMNQTINIMAILVQSGKTKCALQMLSEMDRSIIC